MATRMTIRTEPQPRIKKDPKDLIGNINQYIHLLNMPTMNDTNLEFAYKLRKDKPMTSKQYSRSRSVQGHPPNVFFKTTLTQDEKPKVKRDNIAVKGNFNDFAHLMRKRVGASPTNSTVAIFETSLREQKRSKAISK